MTDSLDFKALGCPNIAAPEDGRTPEDGHCQHTEAFAGGSVRSGTEPEAFVRDVTFESLECAAQSRAIRRGDHGQTVTVILFASHGPELVHGNRRRFVWLGVGGRLRLPDGLRGEQCDQRK